MSEFATKTLSASADLHAPDGAEVRLLPSLAGGSMAHFRLAPGQTTRAVAHRTVEEIWYVVAGEGEMWRRQDDREEVVRLHAGIALTIPLGTHFQFRATGPEPLAVVAVTMPPWPGDDEAVFVEGPWAPSS